MAEPNRPEYFRRGLAECLAEAEQHAVKEVGRLCQVVAQLQAEIKELRQSGLGPGEGVNYPVERLQDTHAERAGSKTGNVKRPSVAKICDAAGEVDYLEAEEPGIMEHEVSIFSLPSGPSTEGVKLQRSMPSVFSAVLDDGRSSVASLEVRDIVSRKKSMASTTWQFYKKKGLAGHLVRSQYFQYGTLFLVFLNALWIAIDLDFNGRPLLSSAPLFQIVENLFVVIFIVEMVVRFCAFHRKLDIFLDGWFIFDLLLVLAMVAESWVSTLVLSLARQSDVDGIGNVSALRNIRLVRIARVAGIARFVPELRTMTNSMLAGVRSVAMTVLILLVLTYGVAVLLRQLGASTSWGDEYFSSVPEAVYSLLVYTVVPEHVKMLNLMRADSWYCALIYLSFLLFTVIMLMNMLVAFLCDVIFRESSSEKDRRNLEIMSTKLMATFESIGLNETDLLSKAQFIDILTDEAAVSILADVGVDVIALADETDYIFSQSHRPFMTFESFKEEVLKFRNSNLATLGSITATRRFLRLGLGELSEKVESVETMVLRLFTEVKNANRQSRTSGSKPRNKAAL